MAPTSGRGRIEATRATAACVASAGASREIRRERLGIRFRLSLLLIAGALVACAGDDETPTRLMDGSTPEALPVKLQNVAENDVALTSVKVTDFADVVPGSPIAECLRQSSTPVSGQVVERIGVVSSSVTSRAKDGRAIAGCDNTSGPREEDRPWCGGAYGQLHNGRLRDPRLDIGCLTEDDDMVGFVWVHPRARARYVSVDQPEYLEVYEVAGDLPVRVSTRSGVQVEGSRATFDLLEHDGDGRLLRRYRLEAAVAG